MPRTAFLAAALSAVLAAALAAPASAQTAGATLKDAQGKTVGSATLTQAQADPSGPAGVLIELSLQGLPPGEHAFHIHENGACEPPFASAGGHFNPGGHSHGLMSASGRHAGDMPNLHVPESGNLTLQVLNTMVSLEPGKPNSLDDGNGSALVIHAGADDYMSDPAGNAGDRIACGVIQ